MSQKPNYIFFLAWLVIVSLGLYKVLDALIPMNLVLSILQTVSDLSTDAEDIPDHTKFVITGILYLLLWWRVVKVVVFQGVPFGFGMANKLGSEHKGISGRPVRLYYFSDSNTAKDVWYLGVFVAHPNSDKLVRSRLRYLMLVVFNMTLTIEESQWSIHFVDAERRHNVLRDRLNKHRG